MSASSPQEIYDAYVLEFGHPPGKANHLLAFSKKHGMKLSWKDANTLLKGGPKISQHKKDHGQSATCKKQVIPSANVTEKEEKQKEALSDLTPQQKQAKINKLRKLGILQPTAFALDVNDITNNRKPIKCSSENETKTQIESIQSELDFNKNGGEICSAVVNLDIENIASKKIENKELGYAVIPVTHEPIVQLHLSMDISLFEMRKETFINDLSQFLGMKKEDLIVLTTVKGSSIVTLLLSKLESYLPKNVKLAVMTTTEKVKQIEQMFDNWKQSFMRKYVMSKAVELIDYFSSVSKSDPNSETKDTPINTNESIPKQVKYTATQQWLLEQSSKLQSQIMNAMQYSAFEFDIKAVLILNNEANERRFGANVDLRKSNPIPLFHGTKSSNINGIFQKGFAYKGKLDSGWYGDGYYFTSYPQYAMHYIDFTTRLQPQSGDCFTLVVAYVDTGEVREINALETGKAVPNGYDCNHVRVIGDTLDFGTPAPPNYNGTIYDEYCIRDGARILPQYAITLQITRKKTVIIWRDNSGVDTEQINDIAATFNQKYVDCQLYAVSSDGSDDDVLRLIAQKRSGLESFYYLNSSVRWESDVNVYPLLSTIRSKFKCDDVTRDNCDIQLPDGELGTMSWFEIVFE